MPFNIYRRTTQGEVQTAAFSKKKVSVSCVHKRTSSELTQPSRYSFFFYNSQITFQLKFCLISTFSKPQICHPTSAAALNLGTTSDLYSEKALMPTFNDLDHMFESDSESSDADAVGFLQSCFD